jgi:hypothetical protein
VQRVARLVPVAVVLTADDVQEVALGEAEIAGVGARVGRLVVVEGFDDLRRVAVSFAQVPSEEGASASPSGRGDGQTTSSTTLPKAHPRFSFTAGCPARIGQGARASGLFVGGSGVAADVPSLAGGSLSHLWAGWRCGAAVCLSPPSCSGGTACKH